MWTTESGTLGATPSSPPFENDPPESSFPVSIEPEITSLLAGESDIVETKAPEIALPNVIEPKYIESKTLQTEVTQPRAPQLTTPITSGTSSSLPLSQTQPQLIYLGPDGEPLPPNLVSIEEIPQQEYQPSSLIHL